MEKSKSGQQHDPEKLLALFRQSKKTVQKFVNHFVAKNGRKPNKDEIGRAPEYVRVCLKNCKRIQAHWSKQEASRCDEPRSENEPQNEQKSPGEASKAEEPSQRPMPADKPKRPSSTGVWGSHLNRSLSDPSGSGSAKGHHRQSAMARTLSYSGTLSALVRDDISKNTRKSLRRLTRRKTADTFFDTMGDESTIQGLIDEATVTTGDEADLKKVDPLVRFHPELSMDGLSQHGREQQRVDDDDELEIAPRVSTTSQPLADANKAKSVSFLAAFNSQGRPEATQRSYVQPAVADDEKLLSFSGLFPKAEKRPNEADEGESEANKRPRLDGSDDDMFADEDQLLPLDNSDNGDKEVVAKRPKKATNKNNGLVSSNFVKINLKKKVFVRGHKNASGGSHRRTEWKRKAAAKFGKKC